MKAEEMEATVVQPPEPKSDVLSDVYSKDGSRRYYKSQLDPKPGDEGYELYRSRIHLITVLYPRASFVDKVFTDYEELVGLFAAKIRKGHSQRFVRGIYIPNFKTKDGKKIPDRVVLEVRTLNPTRTASLVKTITDVSKTAQVKVVKAAEAQKSLREGVAFAKRVIPEKQMDFGPFEFGTRPSKKSKSKKG